jgi:hypothetical protein
VGLQKRRRPLRANPRVFQEYKMSIVNASEMVISHDPQAILEAPAIGSGIGVSVYDPKAQAYERIRQLVETEGFSFLAAEKRILGTDHAEVGGLIAGQWGFSPQMAHIIRNHHLVDSASEADQATAIVYMSGHICMLLGLCAGTDGLAYPFYDEILARLQMTEDTIKRVMVAYLDNRPKVEALLDAS